MRDEDEWLNYSSKRYVQTLLKVLDEWNKVEKNIWERNYYKNHIFLFQ